MAQDKLAELRELLGKLTSLVVAAGATLLLVWLLVAFAQGTTTGRASAPVAAQSTVGATVVVKAGPTATATAGMAHGAEAPGVMPPQDPALVAQGKQLFQSQGCIGCHTVQGISSGAVGPELTQAAQHAAEHLKDPNYKGQARDVPGYIREAIVNPNAYIAQGCPGGPCQPNVMPQTFGQTLKPEQLDALVAFLLSLK